MLINRQKCLYYFLENTNECSKLNLAKIFFTISKESNINQNFKFYNFLPYKFGPYSFELFHDLEKLEKENVIKTDEKQIKFLGKKNKINIPKKISKNVDHFIKNFSKMNEKELINYVYNRYPEYTIFSKIEKRKKYIRDQKGIYTIGYEGKSIDDFLNELIQNKVEYLIDVRKNPWSMKFGYKKYQLKSLTDKINIKYKNMSELGIISEKRKDLNTKKDYKKLLEEYSKNLIHKDNEINFLKKLAEKHKTALMCFEKDPEICHRRILGEKLINIGAEVTLN